MMGVPIPEYCDDCHKIQDGVCTTYPDSPCEKVGLSRGGMGVIGCAFSPMERPEAMITKVRVGQQKTKRSK